MLLLCYITWMYREVVGVIFLKRDKDTKNRLLASARAEFMEKGYMNASLRSICGNAGVTTGALYFFFKDKADLFEALTKETVEGIYAAMDGHFANEHDLAERGELIDSESADSANDFEDSRTIIHMMYQRREDILLVLTRSQGSTMEGLVDKFIDTAERHYRNLAHQMERVYPDRKLDDKFIHWLAHEQIELFVYMIVHIDEEEKAVRFMEQSVAYMVAGWYGLFKNRD